MSAPARPPRHPYPGLSAYSEEDARLFFGREREIGILQANLLASRLTLLYGPAGVGLSSVLQAGVAAGLRRIAEENVSSDGAPEFAVVVHRYWDGDPLPALCAAIDDAGSQGGRLPPAPDARHDLLETLQRSGEAVGGEVLVILDQFEQYLARHDGDLDEFARQLGRAAGRHDVPAAFLIAIREDALGRLDRLRGQLPSLFDNAIRLEPLDAASAREAIVRPLAVYNEGLGSDGPVAIEDGLVEVLLERTSRRQAVIDSHLFDPRPGSVDSATVDASALQLVLSQLWNEEIRSGSTVLRLATLERLGGPEVITAAFVEDAMAILSRHEQDIAADVLRYLVTPSGSKVTLSADDLAFFTGRPVEEIKVVLEQLAAGEVRFVRPVARAGEPGAIGWEIFHDLVGEAALRWRERRDRTESARMRVRARVQRLLFLSITALLVVIAFVAGVAVGR